MSGLKVSALVALTPDASPACADWLAPRLTTKGDPDATSLATLAQRILATLPNADVTSAVNPTSNPCPPNTKGPS